MSTTTSSSSSSSTLNATAFFGTCDGCYCIPDEGTGNSCAIDQQRRSDHFPPTLAEDVNGSLKKVIANMKAMTWLNPYTIDCDPFVDASCQTSPPLQNGSACIIQFQKPNNSTNKAECPTGWNYTTVTYTGTLDDAFAAEYYVTHKGPCGACSNLQDLAVYLQYGPALREASTQCGLRGRSGEAEGTACFQELGFTTACSKIWYYTTNNTNANCIALCGPFALGNSPPNGDAPTCTLADCLQCDEDKSGPVFQKYAGRTRRNSDLLSDTVRPCSEFFPLLAVDANRDPCLASTLLISNTLPPTRSPTKSPQSSAAGPQPHFGGGFPATTLLFLWILSLAFLRK